MSNKRPPYKCLIGPTYSALAHNRSMTYLDAFLSKLLRREDEYLAGWVCTGKDLELAVARPSDVVVANE